MAHLLPNAWQQIEACIPSGRREIETLKLLASGLPDDYTVYHGVHWAADRNGQSVFGDIDFVVVNRSGDLLLIEQVAGFLEETEDGLVKLLAANRVTLALHLDRARNELIGKLKSKPNVAIPQIGYLLFCPHYSVKDLATAGLSPQRIVDAARKGRLTDAIQEVLPIGEDADTQPIHRFLSNVLKLEPDVNALIGRAQSLVTRVSGGLAHWARQLDMSPYRLRVTGTAGSGKTQLALAEFCAAVDAGRKPLYVCYNRPLADHMANILPSGGWIGTFHALCEALLKVHGESMDFSQHGAFDLLVRRASSLLVPPDLKFDVVIVDEGQDWMAEWFDTVLRHAADNARMIWLEDPLQNLYAREPIALPGWVGLRSSANYRSPRPIVRLLQHLVPDLAIESASPIDGPLVEFLTYKDDAELAQQVKMAIKSCYSAGFRKHDVAILSHHGRESSRLLQQERLGDFRFRRFTGNYDLFQRPVYSDGDLVLESVMRFKGQSAPAVVLAELDFELLDDKALRRLFVGATRATMKLVVVLSVSAAKALSAHGVTC